MQNEQRPRRLHGMNWISQHRRLAIYLRDGLSCCYCGDGVLTESKLTLDHLLPYSLGGGNESANLVTCCHTCNSSRGSRDVAEFAATVAAYRGNGLTADAILAHIADCVKREPDVKMAKELVERQGSCFKALQTMKH